MKREVLQKFGQKVRAKRARLGLSQEELAARAGVHLSILNYVSR
ncbi:MAG: helix-turn-helix domain-containing protein [Candidatus Liptonbacteria bacterium]|nr:helix-turn-helix domain-containing protein [Candidatus Liptonbacteria bacterium]